MFRETTTRRAEPRWILTATVIGLMVSSLAAAQDARLEITPTLGYRWGGEIEADENSLLDFDAKVDDGVAYGLVVDFPVTRHIQIELLADHQETSLGRGGLFEPDTEAFGLDITYYQIGALFQWTPPRARPYLVFGVGIADLDPEVGGIGGDTRASASLGGGVKILLSEHVAFRVELRGFWADTDDWGWKDGDHWWDDCEDGCWNGNNDLTQAEAKIGVTFSF